MLHNPTPPPKKDMTKKQINKQHPAHVGVAATTPGPGVHDGFAGAAAAAPPLAPASTSLATTRPPGPVPARADKSMPFAPAVFLANPEATTRPPSDDAAAPPGGAAAGDGAAAAAVDSAAGGGDAGAAAPPPLLRALAYSWTAGMSDSLSTRRPMGPPTDCESSSSGCGGETNKKSGGMKRKSGGTKRKSVEKRRNRNSQGEGARTSEEDLQGQALAICRG